MPLSLVIYGRETCQDTRLVRSRLQALGVPAEEHDVEHDAAAAERVKQWNGGSLSTPTLVFGKEERVVAEPSLAAVDDLARWAGYDVRPPSGVQLHGDVAARSVPSRTLPAATRSAVSIASLRERAQLVLFFPHSTACLACRAYAHGLLTARETLAETGSVAFAVPTEPLPDAVAWLEGEAVLPAEWVLADEGGAWRRQVEGMLRSAGVTELGDSRDAPATAGVPASAGSGGPFVLVLDRWQAPRVISAASEAGGLMSHEETGEWLRFLSQECGECTIELPWDGATR